MNKTFRIFKGTKDIGRILVEETRDIVISPTILAEEGVDLNALVGAIMETVEGPYVTGRVGEFSFFMACVRG